MSHSVEHVEEARVECVSDFVSSIHCGCLLRSGLLGAWLRFILRLVVRSFYGDREHELRKARLREKQRQFTNDQSQMVEIENKMEILTPARKMNENELERSMPEK